MQTINVSHIGRKTTAAAVAAGVAILIALCALMVLLPSSAHAKTYSMPQVEIKATVQPDGTLHVVERRTFDFEGAFTAVWWTQGSLPRYGSYQVNGVRMGTMPSHEDNDELPEMQEIAEVPFETSWRTEGGPGTTAYSVDADETTCYLFSDLYNTKMVAEIDYQINNAIAVYDDVAELYWAYVGDEWAVDSDDVTLTVELPAPEGANPVPEQDIYAWGHGRSNGTVFIDSETAHVMCENEWVWAGDLAGVRIIFPKEWITDADEKVIQGYAGTRRLEQALEEEQKWADETNRENRRTQIMYSGALVLLLIVFIGPIIWALVMLFRYGRELKPTEQLDYWRDVPDKGVHPAVIARLENWNKHEDNQLGAAIMHLANQGAFTIHKGSYEVPGKLGGTKTQDDYFLVRNTSFVPETPVDQETLTLLFKKVGKEKDRIWLGAMRKYATNSPASCAQAMKTWHSKLDTMVREQGYFSGAGEHTQELIYGVAGAYAAIGVGGATALGLFPLVLLLIPAGLLWFLARFAPQRTQKGANVHHRCKALKRWLTDFSSLDERPPTDVKVWGEFMVYAYLFGVAAKTIAALRKTLPAVFEQEQARITRDGSYVPFYGYYESPGFGSSESFSDMLSSSVRSVSAAAAPSASGGGGGGGFSGGGNFSGGFSGGGFGGGGGGGAR